MLSGIKTIKKRKRKEKAKASTTGGGDNDNNVNNNNDNDNDKNDRGQSRPAIGTDGDGKEEGDVVHVHVQQAPPHPQSNLSVAEEIKRQLAPGGGIKAGVSSSLAPPASKKTVTAAATQSTTRLVNDHVDRLLLGSRITSSGGGGDGRQPQMKGDGDGVDERTIILTTGDNSSTSTMMKQREDFRAGARKGKLKHHQGTTISHQERGEQMTVADMVQQEKQYQQQVEDNMDEVYAKNVLRLGSRYKGSELTQTLIAGATAGADEEDKMDMTMYTSVSHRLTGVAAAERNRSRALKLNDRQSQMTAKSWWWLESSQFAKHRLLALGNYVSLVYAPPSESLQEPQKQGPKHSYSHYPTLYLVPLTFHESFASCDDNVWDEVKRFQTALRNMFHKVCDDDKQPMGLVTCETVLNSNHNNTNALMQAKMELFCVPKHVEADAPMYFRSSLTEQIEEWGTHSHKLLRITAQKSLKQCVPQKMTSSFSYFYVDWGGGGSNGNINDGYAQMIESNSFSRDFGADTLSGMMNADVRRMRRGMTKTSSEQEKQLILSFLQEWKPFDWTVHLDK
jgi:hypothetical protein